MTAPGWYPDPQASDQLRWWDGTTWTTHVATPTTGAAAPGTAPAGPPAYGTAPGMPPGMAPPTAKPGRPGWVVGVVIAAAVVLVVAVLTIPFLVGRTTTSTSSPTTTIGRSSGPTTTASGGGEPTGDLAERASMAGIPVLDEEGTATHTHTMLRIVVDGEEIVIPAGIGIDASAGQITAVHTHEPTGALHVESPHRNDVYTVGQFLTLWGVGDDDEALCATFATAPCTVTYAVVPPTDADRDAFERLGPMPDAPPIDADGRDTELAQGAVIEIQITSSS